MAVKVTKKKELLKIDLGDELIITNVLDFKDLLTSKYKDDIRRIKLNAADLEKIDTAGVQMIVSLIKTVMQKKEDRPFIEFPGGTEILKKSFFERGLDLDAMTATIVKNDDKPAEEDKDDSSENE